MFLDRQAKRRISWPLLSLPSFPKLFYLLYSSPCRWMHIGYSPLLSLDPRFCYTSSFQSAAVDLLCNLPYLPIRHRFQGDLSTLETVSHLPAPSPWAVREENVPEFTRWKWESNPDILLASQVTELGHREHGLITRPHSLKDPASGASTFGKLWPHVLKVSCHLPGLAFHVLRILLSGQQSKLQLLRM